MRNRWTSLVSGAFFFCALTAGAFGQAMGRVALEGGAGGVGGAATRPVVPMVLPSKVVETAGPATLPAVRELTPVVGAPAGSVATTAPAGDPVEKAAGTSETSAAGTKSAIEHMAIKGGGGGGTREAGSPESKPASWTNTGWGSLVQVGGALAVVLGLVMLGKLAVKKIVPGAAVGSGKGVIEVLARYPLAKGQAVVLVRIGSQIVALSQGRERSESILVINEPAEVANILGQVQGTGRTSIQAGFSNLMANARMELEAGEEGDATKDGGSALLRMAGKGRMEEGSVGEELESELDEMAAAKRQLLELKERVRTARERIG